MNPRPVHGAGHWARSLAAEPDPRRRAELDAALGPVDRPRVAPIVRVAEEAAASNPELAAMMEAVRAARRERADHLGAAILAGPNRLRLDQEEAAATLLHALLQPPCRGHAAEGRPTAP